MTDASASQPVQYQTVFNRTFIGFLIAAFLAAFNDQCIHAAAMFFAIRTDTLSPSAAIGLMPILFFAPWAIFCTLSAYLADRYSKRTMMIIWKSTEVAIALICLLGFWLGSKTPFPGANHVGAWMLLASVFLMGAHSAFYVPNKYGVLPEIFPMRLLPRANGLVEGASFLAVILGTASGGILSGWFKGKEIIIGLFLLGTSTFGAVASLLIKPMPPSDPKKEFPGWSPLKLYQPLWKDLKYIFSLRTLRLAICSIAFFTFVTVYMRGTMYMHGESQNPVWSEEKTSLTVAATAAGIGMGTPVAGWLSAGKLELGMVPFGTLGMALFCFIAAICVLMHSAFGDVGLIASLIAIGFLAAFYVLPMYTLMQYRAPKGGKGATIAVSNFLNVTGAIVATTMFYGLVSSMHWLGFAPPIQPVELVAGQLTERLPAGSIEVHAVQIDLAGKEQPFAVIAADGVVNRQLVEADGEKEVESPKAVIKIASGVSKGDAVKVCKYTIKSKSSGKEIDYYHVRGESQPLPKVFDNQNIPVYLFTGAAVLACIVMCLLLWQLPDFFKRARIWFRSLGKRIVTISGAKNLPDSGKVVLLTDAKTPEAGHDIYSCTDRRTHVIESTDDKVKERVLSVLSREEYVLIRVDHPELQSTLEHLKQLNMEVKIVPVAHRENGKDSRKEVIMGYHETTETTLVRIQEMLTKLEPEKHD